MPSIMDWITFVTAALIVSLLLLGIKFYSLYKQKKAGKISKIFEFSRKKTHKPDKDIIKCVEEGLLKVKQPGISEEEFNRRLNNFRDFDYLKLGDDDIFWILVTVIFFNMGKKASVVEEMLPLLKEQLYGYERLAGLTAEEVSESLKQTGFEKQAQWCRENAVVFKELIQKHGTFAGYMSEEFGITGVQCTDDKLISLHKDLKLLFEGIGDASGWHMITELGFASLKPDKAIRRIFSRLELVKSEEDLQGTVEVCRRLSQTSGLPIRYIDVIFAKFGQAGGTDTLGTSGGICSENEPKCDICTLTAFCNYYKKNKK